MKKLLVCTDGSDYSDVCCQYGVWLAKLLDASVEAVHVTEFAQILEPTLALNVGGEFGVAPSQELYEQLKQIEDEKTRKTQHETNAMFGDAGLGDRLQYHAMTGDLVSVLDSFESGDDACDVVLLGKRGEHANLAKGHLGSSLERVVRASKKPCMVTPRHLREVKQIAVACDGSDSMDKAINFLKKQSAFKAFNLSLITVDDNHFAEGEAGEILESAKQELEHAGYKPNIHLLKGAIEESIIHFVEHEEIDMLFMGAYGHSRIREFLIGSTTTVLLRCLHIPVMLFR